MRPFFASTFYESIVKLENKEQAAINRTIIKLSKDESSSGLNLEKLKNNDAYSVRVNRDIRIIVYKQNDDFILCYVDHHEKAYNWANRHKFDFHPKTKEAQLIRLREAQEQERREKVTQFMEREENTQPYLSGLTQDQVLSVGVPPEYVAPVLSATESEFYNFIGVGFDSAIERLMRYQDNGILETPEPVPEGADPFDKSQFYMVEDDADLERILQIPWEKWLVFLHASQREYVEGDYDGPAVISGAAGTGKTIVALHRAAALARKNPDAKILFTTILYPLIKDLNKRMDYLLDGEPNVRARITIRSLRDIGVELYQQTFGTPNIINQTDQSKINSIERITSSNEITAMLKALAQDEPLHHIRPEWYEVCDAWGVRSLEEYLNAPRLGKMTQLPQEQYQAFWSIFQQLRAQLKEKDLITTAEMFHRLAEHFRQEKPPFDFVIADEAQDISPPQMKFLSALASDKPNGLFLCRDLAQRIYQIPFSWKACGVDIRGRQWTLTKNYRSSQEMQKMTAHLVPAKINDVDGHSQNRKANVSSFTGKTPTIRAFDSQQEENDFVIQRLNQWLEEGIEPTEIAIFVRYKELLEKAQNVIRKTNPKITADVMQHAKGLEYRAVAIMACNESIVPSQERLSRYAADLGFDEIVDTERQLLYVAASRAREHLLITGTQPISEFLSDSRGHQRLGKIAILKK